MFQLITVNRKGENTMKKIILLTTVAAVTTAIVRETNKQYTMLVNHERDWGDF